MSVDIALLIAILMKNEDVWLKIPSEELFNQAVEVLRMTGVNISTDGNCKLRINSPEMAEKVRQEQERRRLEQESLQTYLKTHMENSIFRESLEKILEPPSYKNGMQTISMPTASRSLFDRLMGRGS